MPPLSLEHFIFEPLVEGDFALLLRWLQSPHMRGHWDPVQSLADVQKQFADKIGSDWQQAFIVSYEGRRFAYVQSYRASKAGGGWWPEAEADTVGIDQFIGEKDFMGRGVGTLMVRTFSDWLLTIPDVKKIITDPSPDNQRAIHCYRNAGFVDCGLVDTPDGKELLMTKTVPSYRNTSRIKTK